MSRILKDGDRPTGNRSRLRRETLQRALSHRLMLPLPLPASAERARSAARSADASQTVVAVNRPSRDRSTVSK